MKRYLVRGVCVLLLVGLLVGAVTALLKAERRIPTQQDAEQTEPLTPDQMLKDRELPSVTQEETEPTVPPTEPESISET